MKTEKDSVQEEKNERRYLPDDVKPLVSWQLEEEKKAYSKDKELLVILVGAGAVILAILVETYIFAVLLAVATCLFTYIGRQKPKKMTFSITDIGLFLDDDFLQLEEVHNFNIIDDPGERARLLLGVQKMVHVNEIVPIYDTDIEQIKTTLKDLGIKEDETLEPSILDHLVKFI